MVRSSRRPVRTLQGRKYKQDRKKRKKELSDSPTLTKISEKKIKTEKTLGGKLKNKTLSHNQVIITGKKVQKATIIRVIKNPANRHFVRMNVLTKGAIVETDKGKVKITNRPGQQSQVQGILVE